MFWGNIKAGAELEKKLVLNPTVIEMSKGEMYLASCMNIFRNEYGFVEATDTGEPKDKNGRHIPLFTYPAIEYIKQFDFKSKNVFEFGAGGSTIFWMNRAKTVTSIENNPQWFEKLTPHLNHNVTLKLIQSDHFPFTISDFDTQFDVIIIDSAGYRYDAAEQAIRKLATNGMIILDNSDWYPNTAAMLKNSGLIQIDMSGFKPCESHTSTTSIFVTRNFDFSTSKKEQPAYAMGAKPAISVDWDIPYAKR